MRYSELKGIRPGTVKFYEQKLGRFFQWLGDQPIDEVSVDDFKTTSCSKETRP